MTARVILLEVSPRRAADGVAETVRLAGGGSVEKYYYGGQHWQAGITSLPPQVTRLEFDGTDLGTGGVPKASEISWAPAGHAKVAALAAYFWIDAALTLYIGPENSAGTMPPAVLTGKVLSATVQENVLRIVFADPAVDLKKPIPAGRFLGTGGIEGPSQWEGTLRRRVWGRVWNVQGQPIDKANNIYCFADPQRQLQAIDAVRDKGASAASLTTVAWAGSTAATFAALQAATPPAGGGVKCPSIACVKWWTQPAGDLTADIKGEIGSGYVETTAEIAERLIQALGTGPGFAAGQVAAAAALRPAPVGWVVSDETTPVSAMLDELFGNVSLLWVLNSAGSIVVRQWAWGASAAAVKSYELARRGVYKPVSVRKIGYQRNELPMSRGDLAAVVLLGDVVNGSGNPVDASDLGVTSGLFVLGAHTTLQGNTTWKDDGTHGAYEGGVRGAALAGSAYVSSSILNLMTGGGWLTTLALDAAAAGHDASTASYSVQCYANTPGQVDVYLRVAGSAVGGTYYSLAGRSATSRLRLVYDGVKVRVLVDGQELVSVAVAAGQTLYPKVLDFYKNTASNPIIDIEYGPYSQNDFGSIGGAGTPEANADVTMLVTGTRSVRVAYDYTVTAKPGQLPLEIPFKLISGAATDLTTAAAWTAVTKSGSATYTIGAATGVLNITAISADAVIEVKATYDGKERFGSATVARDIDAAPSGGSGGGTSDSYSLSAYGVTSSYGATPGRVLSVTAGSGGQVSCSATVDFYKVTNGSVSAYGKWQWRPVGGSFADISSETVSDSPALRTTFPEVDNTPGSLLVSEVKTGLTPGTPYEFQFLVRSAGGSIDVGGSEAAVGS